MVLEELPHRRAPAREVHGRLVVDDRVDAVGCALSAALVGGFVYYGVLEIGRYLGLDSDHYPVRPIDAYVVSDLELAAFFLAGVPTGWYARRLVSLIADRAAKRRRAATWSE